MIIYHILDHEPTFLCASILNFYPNKNVIFFLRLHNYYICHATKLLINCCYMTYVLLFNIYLQNFGSI